MDSGEWVGRDDDKNRESLTIKFQVIVWVVQLSGQQG